MSWFESLAKEIFQAMRREAVQQGLASFKNDLASVKVELEGIKHRLDKLERKVERFYENQMDIADRAGHLEGAIEGRLRGLITEMKYDLYESGATIWPNWLPARRRCHARKAKEPWLVKKQEFLISHTSSQNVHT